MTTEALGSGRRPSLSECAGELLSSARQSARRRGEKPGLAEMLIRSAGHGPDRQGPRSRSVRLRIFFLVAIPLVAMAGLLAYVAGTSIRNAINLDRAPNLINATSLPEARCRRG